MSLELSVWRAVGSHLALQDAVSEMGTALLDELGVRSLAVRRLDVERARVDTRALVSVRADLAVQMHEALEPEEVPELLAWCEDGAPARARKVEELGALGAFVPRGLTGPFILVPLRSKHQVVGACVLKLGGAPGPSDGALKRLRDPLSAALENDHRWHELLRLQNAVEADKRALLSKLDREDISESVVGAETGLREVMERIKQVAPTDVPVLILGETGVGKEVAARAIHARSPRAQGPLVRVNCGAISPELVDSELFGHERGSFTGAVATRQGWFERADGGVLFLDEVGELPLAAQVRLLRVLQDGVLTRVGGTKSVSVDVRVITATHRDLAAMVREGTFRQDLWYRISVFPLRLPPLRERLGDIPALASFFVRRACKRLGMPEQSLSAEDIRALVSYAWPGNVRELSAVIERATILGGGKGLRVAQALGVNVSAEVTAPPAVPVSAFALQPSDATLEAAMVRHIEDALRKTYGRIEGPFGAAKLLSVNPHTLRARMRKLGIEWRAFRTG